MSRVTTSRMFLGAAALVLMFGAAACGRDADDEAPAKASGEASTRVTIAAKDIAANGIEVAAVRQAPDSSTAVTIGYATVADSKALLDEAAQLAAARAQAEQSMARATAAATEAARLKGLHDDGNNASARAVEEADAAYRVEAAASRAAEAAVGAAMSSLRAEWGPVLADGVVSGAEWARELQSHTALLVELAAPDDAPAPRTIELQWRDRLVEARFLGDSPRVDSKLQRPSRFYLCHETEIPSGLTLPVAAPRTSAAGVLVPDDAVVWFGGHAWVFVETATGQFTRTAIGAREHVNGGFVETALTPGTRIVVRGAGQLLSEQNKPAVED